MRLASAGCRVCCQGPIAGERHRKVIAHLLLAFASAVPPQHKGGHGETAMKIDRRTVLIAGASLAFAPAAFAAEGDDMSIGPASARVHLIEYASATCPHCAEFHHENWETLKTRYIDTGRIRFTMREMATAPAPVALAMFQLARCGNADAPEYFRRLAILFERQRAILETGTMQGVRTALLSAGAEWQLSETQVLASLNDQAGIDRIMRSINEAAARGVNSTPSFYLGDTPVDHASFHSPADVVRTLDAALA